jgi:hypothetical protein
MATGEGIVQRRLGSVKIAEQADQGGKNLQRFGAVEGGQVTGGRSFTHGSARVSRASFASVGLQLALRPYSFDWWATLLIYSLYFFTRTTNATLSGRNSHRFPVSHN